jgi:hypothetical protein
MKLMAAFRSCLFTEKYLDNYLKRSFSEGFKLLFFFLED